MNAPYLTERVELFSCIVGNSVRFICIHSSTNESEINLQPSWMFVSDRGLNTCVCVKVAGLVSMKPLAGCRAREK